MKEGDLKAEYLLPAVIDECIHSGKGTVRVLETKDKWFGVTYKEDKPAVVASIQKLVVQAFTRRNCSKSIALRGCTFTILSANR